MPYLITTTQDADENNLPPDETPSRHRDNIADRNAKGRNGRLPGERHGRAKLTDNQAQEIRKRYAAGGVSMRELGAQVRSP